jgi:hypothetical protein
MPRTVGCTVVIAVQCMPRRRGAAAGREEEDEEDEEGGGEGTKEDLQDLYVSNLIRRNLPTFKDAHFLDAF